MICSRNVGIVQLLKNCRPSCRTVSSTVTDNSWIFSTVSFLNRKWIIIFSWKLPQIFLFSKNASQSSGHSSLLADKNEVFEVLTEDVSPGKWEEYLAYKGEYLDLFQSKMDNSCELVASWKFIYGDANFRAMHLFRYPNVSWKLFHKFQFTNNCAREYFKKKFHETEFNRNYIKFFLQIKK